MEKALLKRLIDFRRELHEYPEVSCDEVQTQRRLMAFLSELGIENVKEVGKTGLLCLFDSGAPGPTLMVRGDIDALPIQEINTFPYRSKTDGVSHKCGHDGHATILCGLARQLKDEPIQKGKVALLFQPAEENGEGAKGVLADPAFDIQPDHVIALHNLPGYPLHQIVCREKSFTAAATSIIIKLTGKTSHAAEPELGINPATAISQIIQFFDSVSQPVLDREDFALATPIHLNMGMKSYGVSAGYGEVHYTLRTWSNRVMEDFCKRIEHEVVAIAKANKLTPAISWTEAFSANINDLYLVAEIKQAALELGLHYHDRKTPFKWGEDFGLFTDKFKGAMFGVGSGETCPALHNPDYDFPDEILPTSIHMFHTILKNLLK